MKILSKKVKKIGFPKQKPAHYIKHKMTAKKQENDKIVISLFFGMTVF